KCRIRFLLPFADLVVIAKESHPIPFRTRPLKPSASMVLRLKPRESRTLPGLQRAEEKPSNSKKPRPARNRVPGLFVLSRLRRMTGPFHFSHAIVRTPGKSVIHGLR